jgi:hypothetical protein
MPGSATDPERVQGFLSGAVSALTVGNTIAAMVVVAPGLVRAVRVRANNVGTSGSSVIDLTRNGVSMWTNAANRPTLAAASAGEFANTVPNRGTVQPGDLLVLTVISNGGHPNVVATAALEEP